MTTITTTNLTLNNVCLKNGGNYNSAGYSNTTGLTCTFIGTEAGYSNTTADYNVYVGHSSGRTNTTGGNYNAFLGMNSGYDNTGSYNTFLGHNAGVDNSSGYTNSFIGYVAGFKNTTGLQNTFVGANSGHENTTTSLNTFIGLNAGYNNTTNNNTAVGAYAGDTYANNTGCTFIGYGADANGSYTNATALGNGATATANNQAYIGNASLTAVNIVAGATYSGSDGRFKINVQENVNGLEFIKRLRPVTFQYKAEEFDAFLNQNNPQTVDSLGNNQSDNVDFSEASNIIHSGFIAQEVEQAATDVGFTSSIVRHPANENDYYAISYSEIVVPLVKAVQEQQMKIEELEAKIQQCCNAPSERSLNNEKQHQLEQGQDSRQQINSEQTTSIDLRHADNVILYQNVPNPFGEETNINYYLPSSVSSAIMVFYDNMGKSIKEVILEYRGSASLKVNSSELASGIYSYSIVVDGKVVDSKKMLKNK